MNNSSICIPSNTYLFSIAFVGILILSFITFTLFQLDNKINCNCIYNNNKTFLKEWFSLILILNLFIYIAFFFSSYNCVSHYINTILSYFLPLYILIGFINLIMFFRLFFYILYLKNNCNCAYQLNEKILFWYFVIIIAYIAILLSLLILSFLFFSFKTK